MTDPDATVRTLLGLAGISPSEDEIALLVAAYPEHAEKLQALHAVAAARYESPALIYDPVRPVVDWNCSTLTEET